MTVINIRDQLQLRYEKSLAKLDKAGVRSTDLWHPAAREHLAEVQELLALGFDLPKAGLYVVAAFATAARNPLQELGRSVYYSNPSRFHVLLPLLGEQTRRPPGHQGPGWWKEPDFVHPDQDGLQRRFDDSAARFKAADVRPGDFAHPAARAHFQELRYLMAKGFELPKPGLYVVAAFAREPSNPLQAIGRSIYYRNPPRFHALLPWLGEQTPKRPGQSRPGWWKAPQAAR